MTKSNDALCQRTSRYRRTSRHEDVGNVTSSVVTVQPVTLMRLVSLSARPGSCLSL
jgi:hypothetical protein